MIKESNTGNTSIFPSQYHSTNTPHSQSRRRYVVQYIRRHQKKLMSNVYINCCTTLKQCAINDLRILCSFCSDHVSYSAQ